LDEFRAKGTDLRSVRPDPERRDNFSFCLRRLSAGRCGANRRSRPAIGLTDFDHIDTFVLIDPTRDICL